MEKKKPPKVAAVLGTKAELIKLSPVFRELAKRKISYCLVLTGQHGVHEEIAEHKIRPAKTLSFDNAAKGRGRFASKTGALAWALPAFLFVRRELKELSPEIVLIHGDTMSTTIGALAARSVGRKRPLLVHVEAGLRSRSLTEPFPEEISRRIADSLSDYYFCPTWESAENLLSERARRSRIFVTGNTNIDLVHSAGIRAREARREKYIVAKMHRHENVTSKERIMKFLHILEKCPCKVVLIETENLLRSVSKYELKIPGKVERKRFLPQRKFLSLLSKAALLITDAGGETEEAARLLVPCIQFRAKSERMEAERAGIAIRSTDPEAILLAIRSQLNSRSARLFFGKEFAAGELRLKQGVFGDGKSAPRIASEIEALLSKEKQA